MATKQKQEIIELRPIEIRYATIVIEGDGDLLLNKMNARNERALINRDDKSKQRETPNMWEDLATQIHWKDPLNFKDTYTEIDEDAFQTLLTENKPCITAFGLKKSFCQAVVRNEIDTYSTKFDAAVNLVDRLVPIKFTEWKYEQKLMSPKKGSPILVYQNIFSGWSAQFDIAFTENVYNLNAITNIINLAGFCRGIGSAYTSGYGRYHVVDVK